jgi:hypothetical protein
MTTSTTKFSLKQATNAQASGWSKCVNSFAAISSMYSRHEQGKFALPTPDTEGSGPTS